MRDKPFYPLRTLFNAALYLREQTRTRAIQDAIYYIEAARARLEIAILKEMAMRQKRRAMTHGGTA